MPEPELIFPILHTPSDPVGGDSPTSDTGKSELIKLSDVLEMTTVSENDMVLYALFVESMIDHSAPIGSEIECNITLQSIGLDLGPMRADPTLEYTFTLDDPKSHSPREQTAKDIWISLSSLGMNLCNDDQTRILSRATMNPAGCVIIQKAFDDAVDEAKRSTSRSATATIHLTMLKDPRPLFDRWHAVDSETCQYDDIPRDPIDLIEAADRDAEPPTDPPQSEIGRRRLWDRLNGLSKFRKSKGT